MKPSPPKHALNFLRWFCREDYLEEIEGDLTEIFENRYHTSPGRAKAGFFISVLRYFRPAFMKSFRPKCHSNPADMIHHNLLITYRNILRYKGTFFINLAGLTTGLACALLIWLWVYDELSFDKFHVNDDHLYEVFRNTTGPLNTIETHPANSTLLPPALEAEMPEVEYVVPLRPTMPGIVTGEKESVRATGMFAGKDFFNAFTYSILAGNGNKLLTEKYAMVISDALAVKLFGSPENSIGKAVVWDVERQGGGTHIVSGVFQKPERSSMEFDFLATYDAFLERSRMDNTWQSNPIMVCLTLNDGIDARDFNTKLNRLYRSKRGEDAGEMFVQRFSDRYLYGRFENGRPAGGRIDYVILFSIIGVFILMIACINFMNLSTARASRRVKEVGIRKTVGAMRGSLALQHLAESMCIAVCALFVAVLLVILLLPEFNLITGKQLALRPDGYLISGALVIVLVTGLVSGSYPALYLSAFRPAEVLKGKFITSARALWVRRGLVIFQFSISVLLIVAVGVVYQQLNFIQSVHLGYMTDNIVTFERRGKLNESLESFLAEVKNIPGVVMASSSSESVTDIRSTSSGHTWETEPPGTPEIRFTGLNVDYDFIETLGIQMKEGRPFSRDFGTEEAAVILNGAAIEAMGLADPVGKWMELFGVRREIVGVVKDFHFQSMYESIKPMFLLCNPSHTRTILIRTEPGRVREALAGIEKLYHRYNPRVPFEATFLDDQYNALYVSEQRVALLSKYFASITIVISCLGLFGLAAFTAERRTKEIGMRKILGASEIGIVNLLSADFTKMVLAAIVIALPVGYFLSRRWLDSFAYRIELEWWYFSGAGALALLIAWLTVIVQTIRSARINPSECLRVE